VVTVEMPTVAWFCANAPLLARAAPAKAPAIKIRLLIMMHLLHLAAKRYHAICRSGHASRLQAD
jgi:hypothetical protein